MTDESAPERAIMRPLKILTMADRRKKFIKKLRISPNVSKAAKYAGMDTSTAYRHRQKYAGFREEWDAAINEALDTIEEVLAHRILHGVERPHFHGGKIIGTYKTYSDALLMFYLRAKRPESYSKASADPSESGGDTSVTLLKQLDIIAEKVKDREKAKSEAR